MKVEKRAFGSMRAVNQLPQIIWHGTFETVFVGLTKQEASSWRWLQELGGQKTSKAAMLTDQSPKLGSRVTCCEFSYFTIVDCPAEVW